MGFIDEKTKVKEYTNIIFEKMILNDIFDILISSDHKNFYLIYNSKIVGYAKASIYYDKVGYVSQIFIKKDYRNKSEGNILPVKILYSKVDEWFFKSGMNSLEFEVYKSNKSFLKLVEYYKCNKTDETKDSCVYRKDIKKENGWNNFN